MNKIFTIIFLTTTLFLGTIGTSSAFLNFPDVTVTNERPSNPSVVQLKGYQLIVDGKPFIMKGVCYNPVPKGGKYPDNLILTKKTFTIADLSMIDHDFEMMEEAGINTIRTYKPIVDLNILDLLDKHHLYTVVPLLPSADVNFTDLDKVIHLLKKEHSTLIWEVGNEWNYNHFYSGTQDDSDSSKNQDSQQHTAQYIGWQSCINAVNDIVSLTRIIDNNHHPISTCIGELPADPTHKNDLGTLDVDLYGTNIYDGLGFGDRFQTWANFTSKPIYVSEFGCDAYNMNLNNGAGSEDQESQAFALDHQLTELEKNLSALDHQKNVIGGDIFEWNDEWWKDPEGSPWVHNTGGIQLTFTNDKGEEVPLGGPYPDHFFNEEWFGLLSLDRQPRQAYKVVQKHFLTLGRQLLSKF